MSNCSSPTINPTEQETLIPFLNALRFYALKTKPIIQRRQEIRSGNQVLALKDNCWRLSVRRPTINPAKKHFYRYRTHSGFTYLIQNPTARGNYEWKPSTFFGRKLLASNCSSFYHQSGQETLLALSNAIRFYVLKTKPNIQLRKEIWSENQVLVSKGNYWRLSVRRSTINPA